MTRPVDDEMLHNDIARWLHRQRHKSERTYFCESDRTLAEQLIDHFVTDRGWIVVEDDRSA